MSFLSAAAAAVADFFTMNKRIVEARKELAHCFTAEFDAEKIEQATRIVERCPEVCKQRDKKGFLPLHLAIRRHVTLPFLELLVSCNPKAVDIPCGSAKTTPLHTACRRRWWYDPQVFSLLITPKSARAKDSKGRLPLHFYCRNDGDTSALNLQVIQLLVRAHPDSVIQVDSNGQTPLHWAVWYTHRDDVPSIQYLVESCPQAVRQADQEFGKNPLHYACQWNLLNQHGLTIIRLLAEACPEAAGMLDHESKTPLHRICVRSYSDSLQIIRVLVQACPECVQVADHAGHLPLHIFCENARDTDMDVVEYLVDAYPQALTLRDMAGCTPLHVAEHSNRANLELARILVQKCPEVLELDDTTSERGTPLHQLCKGGLCGSLFDFLHELNYLKTLALSEKAVKAKNIRGQIPMHLLCQGSAQREMLQVMFDLYPKIAQEKDNQGRIPLHLALLGSVDSPRPWRYYETIDWLLQVYPDGVRMADNDGMTPLELACEKNASVSLIYQLVSSDPVMNLGLTSRLSHPSRKRKRVARAEP